jgi:hypothetical protein
VSRNLLRAQSAASRVPPKILTYVQVGPVFGYPRFLQPGLLVTISGHILRLATVGVLVDSSSRWCCLRVQR